MSDAGRRRRAKQARRNARRAKRAQRAEMFEILDEDEGLLEDELLDDLEGEAPEETSLIEEVRQALTAEHPLDLLSLVALLLEATTADSASANLDELLTAFVGVPIPETTALLAVLAELSDDDAVVARCRAELAVREHTPPAWIAQLPQVQIQRVVRMTHVLGEGDEVVIGTRLADGEDLTCAVHLDHTLESLVSDAFFLPAAIDTMVAVAQEHNTDPDTSFEEMTPADARAWVENGIEKSRQLGLATSESWPACRPLLTWLLRHLPDGGRPYQPQRLDAGRVAELFDEFFAHDGSRFADGDHRRMLEEIAFDSGTGDPLRWSAARMVEVLNTPSESEVSQECLADLPDLLRAYIPFAHARSGIREELTAEALAVLD
jgi:hypothetical protein